jgi:hypothetical protein
MNGLTMNNKQLQVGQAVKVKEGIEVDGFDISGWQGRIGISEDDGSDMILIEWDSLTMKALPLKYILSTLRITDEDSFNHFYLGKEDIELAKERDSLREVRKIRLEICQKYAWKASSNGSPEEELLAEIMSLIDTDKTDWYDYLEENLEFPFETVVSEGRSMGTKFKIFALEDEDEHYGIIAFGKSGRNSSQYPFCDLTATDKKSKNYLITRAYAIWFANQ